MKINADLTVSIDHLNEFQNIIGVTFNDTKYLIQALLHGTLFSGDKVKLDAFKKQNNLEDDNYEKLEKLGDAVLDLIVIENFYKDEKVEEYAKAEKRSIESVLNDIQEVLVNNDNLKPLAPDINLEKYILQSGLVYISDVFERVIEALIGSIFLDNGYPEAKNFVLTFFDIDGALGKIGDINPKGKVKEFCEKQKWDLPRYEKKSEEGPDHDKTFIRELYIRNELVSEGKGKTKTKAEEEAARKYLNKIKSEGTL